jgi:hypothetical protein
VGGQLETPLVASIVYGQYTAISHLYCIVSARETAVMSALFGESVAIEVLSCRTRGGRRKEKKKRDGPIA